MKKTLIILFVAAFATAAHAQHHNETPTLPTERTDSYLIDSVSRSVMFSSTCYLGGTITYGNSLNDYDISVRLDTAPEGLTIYGIAISAVHYSPGMVGYEPTEQDYCIDTSRANWREYTCLYKQIEDSMVLVAKAAYNVFDEPDYLLPPYLGIASGLLPVHDTSYFEDSVTVQPPLYETYFDTAYYVTDSFYYGTTQINNKTIVKETGSHSIGLMVFYMFLNEPLLPFYPYAPLKVRYNGYLYSEYGDIRPASVALYDTIFWRDHGSILSSNIYILFPILSPDPARTTPTPVDTVRNYFDTTQVVDPSQGGDTAQADTIPDGIVSAKLLERYVNVYPSVTDGGTVSVMSSFRLEAVEVYDAAGRMVSRQPASGLVAAVDASQLPAGAYLLNIKTVSGTATKKLVIQ